MIVHEQPERARAIFEAARQRQETERAPGLHVSDLICCLRKYWYQQRQPIPLDEATEQFFLLGQSQHILLQPGGGCELAVTLPLAAEVHGTVDVYGEDWPWERATEIKTTRTDDAKEAVYAMPGYVEQLASYCLALGETIGVLVVWYIFAFPPVLKAWGITFTREELDTWKHELSRRLAILKSGDDPGLGEHDKKECRYCPYWKKNQGPCEGGEGRGQGFFFPSNYL